MRAQMRKCVMHEVVHGRQQAHHARQGSRLSAAAAALLPQVQVASEQLSSAMRKAQRMGSSKTLKNEAAKARNRWRAPCLNWGSSAAHLAQHRRLLNGQGGMRLSYAVQTPLRPPACC